MGNSVGKGANRMAIAAMSNVTGVENASSQPALQITTAIAQSNSFLLVLKVFR
jgi:hypothetical protein